MTVIDRDVRALIAEARSDEPTDWRSLAWHLADALEALDSAPREAEHARRVADFEHTTGFSWSPEYEGSREWDATLDSAPPVARALPDREALADAIELALDPVEFELVRYGTLGSLAYRAADAVLTAIEKGGESNE